MQQQVAMNRNLSRLEFVIDGLAELLGSGHCLIQDVGFIVFAKRIREVPQKVGTRNESQATRLRSSNAKGANSWNPDARTPASRRLATYKRNGNPSRSRSRRANP